MIKSIHCKDFQAHKNTTLEFSPNITCIVGENGSGKTAIFRALKAVLLNDCLGDAFIRLPDAKRFTIELTLGDSTVITRTKGDKNSVAVSGLGTWEDFNREYPHQVTDATKIKEVLLGDKIKTILQIQGQLDPPYMLVGTPDSTKMKFLNRLSGSYLLSEAIKQANTDLTKHKQIVTSSASAIDQLTFEKKQLNASLSTYNNIINYVESRLPLIEDMEKQLDRLTMLKNSYLSWVVSSKEVTKKLKYTDKAPALEHLTELIDKYENLVKLVKKYNKVLEELDNVQKSMSVQVDTSTLESLLERYTNLKTLYKNYNQVIDDVQLCDTEIKQTYAQVEEQKALLDKELSSMKECPICGTVIDKEKIMSNLIF